MEEIGVKIVAINGQNHKGSTWQVGNKLVEKIAGENMVQEFFLPKDLNHFCMGCFACLKERERCPFWNEKEIIMQAILEADLLILTSPNYCMMPSAPMKAFLDLFYTNWMTHKPYQEMFNKRAVIISTTAGAGAKKATKLIADNLMNWGVPQVTEYGVAVNAMNWNMVPEKIKNKIEKSTDKIAAKLSKNKKIHIGLRTRFMFWLYGGMQKADWGASEDEKQYWLEKGWLSGKKPWR